MQDVFTTNMSTAVDNLEVLEFFGDSVLHFISSLFLLHENYMNENQLTQARHKWISNA